MDSRNIFTSGFGRYKSVRLVDWGFGRLDHLCDLGLCLRRAHVQTEATDLCRNVLDPVSNGSEVRRPVPRLAVDAVPLIGGVKRRPQWRRNNLPSQRLGPLRMSAFRSSMTSGQRGDSLNQFTIRSIVIVVVVAGRTARFARLFLLVRLHATAADAPLMDWC